MCRDGSDAIAGGASYAFNGKLDDLDNDADPTDVKQAMCYAHVKRNYQKYSTFLALPREIRQEIDEDIDTLQIVWTENLSDVGRQLFLDKWESHDNRDIDAFLHDFSREYFENPKLVSILRILICL